jgi:hypothetical protein
MIKDDRGRLELSELGKQAIGIKGAKREKNPAAA